jgi:hypothetical protein
MKRQSLYRYYAFGYNYNNLLKSQGWTNKSLLESLNDYFQFISELELPVTLSGIGMKGLGNDRQELRKCCRNKNNRSKPADQNLVQRIKDKLGQIDTILDAELNTKVGYIPYEKRYPLKYLTDKMSNIFGQNVFTYLPRIAQYDFYECGMCLALDRHTACAFHILRGTEDVLKFYYSKLLNKTPSAAATWGSFLKALSTAVKAHLIQPEPPEELMLNLESLRKYYRNRTQHPLMIYSGDRVEDLLGLCIKTVNEIIRDLGKRTLLP